MILTRFSINAPVLLKWLQFFQCERERQAGRQADKKTDTARQTDTYMGWECGGVAVLHYLFSLLLVGLIQIASSETPHWELESQLSSSEPWLFLQRTPSLTRSLSAETKYILASRLPDKYAVSELRPSLN